MKKGGYAYYLDKMLRPTLVLITDVEEVDGVKRYCVTHVRPLGRKGPSWWCSEPSLFPTLVDAKKRVMEIIQTRRV
jgi:hypothetical protein